MDAPKNEETCHRNRMQSRIPFSFLVTLFLGLMMGSGCEEKKMGKPPVIHQSFAAKQIRLGDTWKIYLQASDPDGDMKTIVCTIDQAGAGTYPASYTSIPEDQRRELSGYIYKNLSQSGIKLSDPHVNRPDSRQGRKL
ncbi:MAG: hypothetical protein NTY64_09420 [Deltaproteobacteria bacterium]|nr:hypothetical protein [Deltaproteobacteria bacterium]